MSSSPQRWHDTSDARLYGAAAMHGISLFPRGWMCFVARLCKTAIVAAWPIYFTGGLYVLFGFFADKLAGLVSKQWFTVIEIAVWLVFVSAGALVIGGTKAISDELACEIVLQRDGSGTRSSDFALHSLRTFASSLSEHSPDYFEAFRTLFDLSWYTDPMNGVRAAAVRIGLFDDDQIRRLTECPPSRLGSSMLNLLLTLSLVSLAFVPSIAYAVAVDIDSVSSLYWSPAIGWFALVYTWGKLTTASLGLTLLRRSAGAPAEQGPTT